MEMCSNDTERQTRLHITVQPCDGTSTSIDWCCGGSTECCNAGSEVRKSTLAKKFGDPVVSVASTSASTPTASSSSGISSLSSAAPSTATAPNTQPRPSGLSSGAKAGIGIGVALGVSILLAIAFILWKRTRRHQSNPSTSVAEERSQHFSAAEMYEHRVGVKPLAQLGGTECQVYELPENALIAQMDETGREALNPRVQVTHASPT
ncbi:hypothetical protein ACN47E_008679 [Coniothyrium glycines]